MAVRSLLAEGVADDRAMKEDLALLGRSRSRADGQAASVPPRELARGEAALGAMMSHARREGRDGAITSSGERTSRSPEDR